MITGSINSNMQPIIQVTVLDARGQQHSLDAIVDTGFTGCLTLPLAVIISLGVPWHSWGSVVLANGSTEQFDSYAAAVIWDGIPRNILVEASDVNPLVGMGLLAGFELKVEAVQGGQVLIFPMVP